MATIWITDEATGGEGAIVVRSTEDGCVGLGVSLEAVSASTVVLGPDALRSVVGQLTDAASGLEVKVRPARCRHSPDPIAALAEQILRDTRCDFGRRGRCDRPVRRFVVTYEGNYGLLAGMCFRGACGLHVRAVERSVVKHLADVSWMGARTIDADEVAAAVEWFHREGRLCQTHAIKWSPSKNSEFQWARQTEGK